MLKTSLRQPSESSIKIKTDSANVEPEKSSVQSISTPNDEIEIRRTEEPCSMISFETSEAPDSADVIRQPSPPPVLTEVQDLIAAMSPQVTETECQVGNSLSDAFDRSEPLQLHIVRFYYTPFFSIRIMDILVFFRFSFWPSITGLRKFFSDDKQFYCCILKFILVVTM